MFDFLNISDAQDDLHKRHVLRVNKTLTVPATFCPFCRKSIKHNAMQNELVC